MAVKKREVIPKVVDTKRRSVLHFMSVAQKMPARSPIMKAVHEAAADLHRHGFIDQHRMRKYDLMCLEPVTGHDTRHLDHKGIDAGA